MNCDHVNTMGHAESFWWWTCTACGHQQWDGRRTILGAAGSLRFETGTRVRFLARVDGQPRRMEGAINHFFMKDLEHTKAVYAMVIGDDDQSYENAVVKFEYASAVDALGSLCEPETT